MTTNQYYKKKEQINSKSLPQAKKDTLKFNTWIEYIEAQVRKSKLSVIILLLSATAYAGRGPWGDDNPGKADPPNDNCAFCDDDEPNDETPIGYTCLTVIGALALGFCLTKKTRL